jgi:hypothetical protein
MSMARTVLDQAKATVGADRAVLQNAMHLYYREHRAWPKTGAELAPFLADAPRYEGATIATQSDGRATVTFFPKFTPMPTIEETVAGTAGGTFTISPPAVP